MAFRRSARLSRRSALILLGSSPALLTTSAFAAQPDNPEQMLRRAINNLQLPFAPGRLELLHFEHMHHRTKIIVRLTWPPGMRRREFSARTDTPAKTVGQIAGQLESWISTLS